MYRFALLGCGRIAGKHEDALKNISNAELVAVCDKDEKKARLFGQKAGVPYYTDYNKMLKQESVDVVSILTPSGLHARHTIDIVRKYQKNIVCEKPLALTLDDADKMISICDEEGVRLFVVKQNRYNLPVQKTRKALVAGSFGKIVMGTVRVRWCRRQEYYDMDSWRGTWELDGGVIANQASHHIDLLVWMLGEPVSVMAKTGTYLSDIEVDDTAAAIIKFKSGALGIVEATTATRPSDLEGSLSVLGEKGSVVIEGFAVNRMKTWDFSHTDEKLNRRVVEKYSELPPNVYGFGHKRFLENVIDCLSSKKRALVDGLEARKSLELITAIYESVATGREIYMRFSPHYSPLGKRHEQ